MNHTVEKIGGTSMSRFGEIMQNVIIADRTPAERYGDLIDELYAIGETEAFKDDLCNDFYGIKSLDDEEMVVA